MKVKDIIKKQTTIVALAVVLVVVAAIGVSYAIFFNVNKSDVQVINAGTLEVTIDTNNALDLTEPKDETNGLKSTPLSYTVKNTETLPASYSLYIYEDSTNQISLDKIKISTDGGATTAGTSSKAINAITDKLVENGKTYYKIDSGTVGAKSSATTKYIRVWIDEDSLTDDVENKKASLNLYIVSEVQE